MKRYFLLLFALFFALPSVIMGETLGPGEEIRIDAPSPFWNSDYQYLDHTNWTCIPPVEIVYECKEYVRVRATKNGTGSVSCTAYYKKNWSDLSTQSRTGHWMITCTGFGPDIINVSPKQKTIKVGEKFTATCTLTPYETYNTVKWSSDDENIAYVYSSTNSECEIKGKKAGTTWIWAKASNGKEDYCKVTVEGGVPVTKIKLNYTSETLEIGEKLQIKATVEPDNATDKSVSWSSSNNSVATVSSSGLVEAKSSGSTTITCTANDGSGVKAICSITVKALRDGDTFSLLSEGSGYNTYQLMTFQVLSTKEKTCRVGWYDSSSDYYGHAISEYENGTYYPMPDSINIPSSVYGFTVTEIGKQAFAGYPIKYVFIPNTVKTIGDGAFSGCSDLLSVSIPNGVISIGEQAFGSSGLKSIVIPPSIKNIGNEVFWGMNEISLFISDLSAWMEVNLGYMHLNNNISLYLNNQEVKSLIIPSNVTEIKDYAFMFFGGLTSVTIPASVKSIGGGAFYGCSGLNEVRSEIKNPFDINESVFSGPKWNEAHTSFYFGFTDATLYVPAGTKAKYKAAAGWKKFKNIVEEGGEPTLKGDVNGDSSVDVADISAIITVMAGRDDGSRSPRADVNGDGATDVADISRVITIMAELARRQQALTGLTEGE